MVLNPCKALLSLKEATESVELGFPQVSISAGAHHGTALNECNDDPMPAACQETGELPAWLSNCVYRLQQIGPRACAVD